MIIDNLVVREGFAGKVHRRDRACRRSLAPNVPTVAESGYPGFKTATRNGLAAPAKTPSAVVERLATELRKLAQDPAFVHQLEAIGVEVVCNSPAEFASVLKNDPATWSEAVRMTGAKVE